MAGLTWDIQNDSERTRYLWPHAAVQAWWRDALREGWGRATIPPSKDKDVAFAIESAEDRVLNDLLTKHGLNWWQPFGPGEGGKSLFWDPFRMPLFDPETGELSPKHPDSDIPTAWTREIQKAFNDALLARLRDGRTCRGSVLPAAFDVTLPDAATLEDDVVNPPLKADLSRALIADAFCVSRRRFEGPNQFAETQFGGACAFDRVQFKGDTSFKHAHFNGPADFEDVRFWDEAGFQGASFQDAVLFEGTQFSGTANFERAAIGGAAQFARAQFLGAQFSGAVFHAGADFENTQLLGAADFSKVTFTASSRFEGSQFSGTAGFERARFFDKALFEGAQFSGTADFGHVVFSSAAQFNGVQFPEWIRFDGARFCDAARFETVVFTGRAAFAGAHFEEGARFDTVQFWSTAAFEGARFAGLTLFKGARFSGPAGFTDAVFAGWAGFGGARFSEAAAFDGVTFKDCALFEEAQFAGTATFLGTRFAGKILFEGAQFWRTVDFSLGLPPHRRPVKNGTSNGHEGENGHAAEPDAEPDAMELKTWRDEGAFHTLSFAGAFFLDYVRFDNRLFLGRSNFKDTVFCKPPEFHGADLHRQTSFLRAKFYPAPGASRKDLLGAVGGAGSSLKNRLDGYEWDALRGYLRELKDKFGFDAQENDLKTHGDFAALHTLRRVRALSDYLKGRGSERTDTGEAFEHAFQTLKNAMRDRRGRTDEQRYFALELKSRRKRQDGEVSLLEWLFSWGYDLTSGHGRYIWRPIVLLILGLPLLMSLSYGAITSGQIFEPLPDYLWFVVEPSLNPFAANRIEGILPGFASLSDWQRLGLNVTVGVHRFLVILLLFLTALAIRRRFQIQ